MINKYLIEQHLRAGGTFEEWRGDPQEAKWSTHFRYYIQYDGSVFWGHDPYDKHSEYPEWQELVYETMEQFLHRIETLVELGDYYYRLM